jgi:hypothetical protein
MVMEETSDMQIRVAMKAREVEAWQTSILPGTLAS